MAETRMFTVAPDFDMNELVGKIAQMYQAKGFTVAAMPMGAGTSISFKKGEGGIQQYIGLGLGVRANIMPQGGNMSVNFSDADWTWKIVALVAGWFLCLIPVVTGAIGAIQQAQLPKEIGNDIQMLAGGGSMLGGFAPVAPQPYAAYPAPAAANAEATNATQKAAKSAKNVPCKGCGNDLKAGSKFCPDCGASQD
ncbi:MAG: zinc ribbon domain-containing protein [Coriobacteriia bacterium]|nr:zinc ribbon domain-containing protein [Coriobacteriia bacterium]